MRSLAKAATGAIILLIAGPAHAQDENEPDSTQAALGPGGEGETPTGDESGQSVTLGDVTYSIVKGAGVVVLDVSDPADPVVTEVLLPGHDALALQIAHGRLLVILEGLEASAFDLTDPRHPVEVKGAADEPEEPEFEDSEPELMGSVAEVDKGWVILDIGSADGVEPGMRFAIRDATAPSWTRPHAIVVVSKVEEETSAGPLPSRGTATPGDLAVEVAKPWGAKHWLAAALCAAHTRFVLELRPIFAVGGGHGKGGFISHLELFHQFEKPWGIGLLISPVGLGVSEAGAGALFDLGAVGGYSGRSFGFQLGAGAHLSTGLRDHGFLILLRARFGPANGVHGLIRLSIIPDSAWYMPSTASAALFFPVRPHIDLFLEFSGGSRSLVVHGRTGWANILGGMRAFVRGSGGPGTVILSGGAGHGYVRDETCEDEEGGEIPCRGGSTMGLLLSLGVEWRF